MTPGGHHDRHTSSIYPYTVFVNGFSHNRGAGCIYFQWGGEAVAYDMVPGAQDRAYGMKMSGRERMELSGVSDVSGFDENTVVLTTAGGELTVRGSELHIERIDLDVGELELRGHIQEFCYEDKSPSSPFWARLFG